MTPATKDLVVLLPDMDMENATLGLIERLEMRDGLRIQRDVFRHPLRDSGCLIHAHEFLRQFWRRYRHALVMFDRHGCGREGLFREELERDVEDRLASCGWGDRAACVVIDPELEMWIWSDSPHVARVFGWSTDWKGLRRWLAEERLWLVGDAKPTDPKRALEETLRRTRVPRSSALYRELAQKVDHDPCQDEAFRKLRRSFHRWFGSPFGGNT